MKKATESRLKKSLENEAVTIKLEFPKRTYIYRARSIEGVKMNASEPAETCVNSTTNESSQVDAATDDDNYCPVFWDTLMCWPRSEAGTLVQQSCFAEFNGIKYDSSQNASRLCQDDGSWSNSSDYSQCRELKLVSPESENSVEMTTHLYLFGYCLSLLTLLIAVSFYHRFRELRCLRNIIHMNLMYTYILADLLWCLNTVSQLFMGPNVPLCVAFFSLYHYFQLTNFFWMFVEGLYLWLLVVRPLSGTDCLTLRLCVCIGWIFPLSVMLCWATAKYIDGDQVAEGIQAAALTSHCSWMLPHPIYDYIYEVPALVALAFNVLFLVMIMWVLITKLQTINNEHLHQSKKAAKALLVLLPLLGVTYVLVLFGPTNFPAFDYLRAVLLSTQGFWVALFYGFLSCEVRNAMKTHYTRWLQRQDLDSQANGRRYYAYWPRSRTESISLYYFSDYTVDQASTMIEATQPSTCSKKPAPSPPRSIARAN
ncbi:diuretic hormone receptor-like isoform X2 [Trichogramma pretiosum]|uniref:diuretic hormone receptor-like isoform X2 n=1 Tax=Trichogramma pretiosum TaxID=7493 RepID=UPI000C71BB2F|nr:diuretic hormone receptor-like isoform X2 [Trichogramma pretiosum]